MRFVYGRLGRVRMRVLKQEPESFLFFFLTKIIFVSEVTLWGYV